jgi:hypothetical protein
MTKYLSALMALAAAVVGCIGGTADAAATGLQRITLIGWIAIAAALVSFSVIVYETRRDHSKIRWQESQRKTVASIAHAELRLALRRLTGPFLEIFGDDWSEFTLVPKQAMDGQARSRVAETDLRAQGPYTRTDDSKPAWWQIFQEAASQAAARIDRVLQIYATYLDAESLGLISELRSSQFLADRLLRLDDLVELNRTLKTPLHFRYVESQGGDQRDMFGYEDFWRLLTALDARLDRDERRLRHRV